jgi:hypothetical protein
MRIDDEETFNKRARDNYQEPATAKTGSGFVINDVAELHEYNKRKCAFEKGKFACVSSSLLY